MSTYQRAVCPICRKPDVALSKTGTLHAHGPRLAPCSASGLDPRRLHPGAKTPVAQERMP